MIRILI